MTIEMKARWFVTNSSDHREIIVFIFVVVVADYGLKTRQRMNRCSGRFTFAVN